jgi:molecular chaperone DnaK (HSP70)
MPSSFTRIFGVDEAGATDVNIRVLQGESGQAPDVCTELGSFDLRGIDPRFDASYRIEVELRISKNGVLTAKAYDAHGGRTADLQLQYQGIQA